jgi:hypothetical protein
MTRIPHNSNAQQITLYLRSAVICGLSVDSPFPRVRVDRVKNKVSITPLTSSSVHICMHLGGKAGGAQRR